MTRAEKAVLLGDYLITPSEAEREENARDEIRCELEAEYLYGGMDDDDALRLRAIYDEENWNERMLPFFQADQILKNADKMEPDEKMSAEMRECLSLDE